MTSEGAPQRILVVDDEASIRWVLREAFTADGHVVDEAESASVALDKLATGTYSVAFVDVRLPDASGLDLVNEARKIAPDTTIVVMTAQTTMANAVEAMKRGAYDYLTKPFDLDVVRLLVRRVGDARRLSADVDTLKSELRRRYEIGVDLVGTSAVMQEIYKLIGRIARSQATVLVQGESGTGKELIAKAIHYHSPRWQGPFVAVNCSAIPKELLESELFGHERGAFTGAIERRSGRFEQATGGTLFLAEIGDMPIELQTKLLRVLQEREFSRVGGREILRVDARIVSATNQNLAEAVRTGQFREDLYFRLNVVRIGVPPLRERPGDLPTLVAHFLERMRRDMGLEVRAISEEAESLLRSHSWPGNVRELENALIRAAVVARDSILVPSDFALETSRDVERTVPRSLADAVRSRVDSLFEEPSPRDPVDLYDRLVAELEIPLLDVVLSRSGGNQVRAAKLLGINRNTLRKKLADHGLLRRLREGPES